MRLNDSARLLVPALFAATLLAAAPIRAALTLPPILGSGMVLQSGMPVPIWGTATAGDKVVVEFAGQRKETVADAQGKWSVKLDPLETSVQPRTMTVTAGSGDKPERQELTDILVGEVWVGSGQSNMALTGGFFMRGDPVLASTLNAEHPLLRLYAGAWKNAVSNENRKFSSLLFAFGQKLQQELGVPVGLMCGAIGGTPSGSWLSETAYRNDPACKAEVDKAIAAFDPKSYDARVAAQMAAWTQAVEAAKQAGKPKPAKPHPPLKPGESRARVGKLYDNHIRPFQPYAIRGVLWDQGESGTGINGVTQETLMKALIRGWRQEWGQGDFPFLVVQKPSGGGCAFDRADPVTRLAEPFAPLPASVPVNGQYREEHIRLGLIPGVTLVPSTDLGSGIHPLCKSGYGARAARVALGAVYKQPVAYSGPAFQAFAVEGGKIRIRFDHVGKGLAVPLSGTNAPARLQGFAVAGTNRVFQWAKAAIEGDSVVVESDQVPAPVAVRYGWAATHPWANLFNKDGFPAQAFRTDTW